MTKFIIGLYGTTSTRPVHREIDKTIIYGRILTVTDNGLASQRIYFQSTKQFKGHLQQNASFPIGSSG